MNVKELRNVVEILVVDCNVLMLLQDQKMERMGNRGLQVHQDLREIQDHQEYLDPMEVKEIKAVTDPEDHGVHQDHSKGQKMVRQVGQVGQVEKALPQVAFKQQNPDRLVFLVDMVVEESLENPVIGVNRVQQDGKDHQDVRDKLENQVILDPQES